MRKHGRLHGKTAVITGAGAGFGAAMAKLFVREGARVLVVDINLKKAESVAAALGEAAFPFQADISRLDDNHHIVEEAILRLNTIDIFVANAGFTHPVMPLEHVGKDAFDLVNAITINGLYYGVHSVLPVMEQQNSGCIITLGAITAERPRKGLTWFSAAKGWVIAATRAMAVELADRNIRVNCLCPSESNTETSKAFLGTDADITEEKLAQSIPLRRLSKPEDIAEAALWLASDEASYITGTILPVDGGYRL